MSFLVVSWGYFFSDVACFGKQENGNRRLLAAVVLFPYLILARAVWELQIRCTRSLPWQEVDESLIVARRLRPGEFPEQVSTVIDLTSELIDPLSIRSLPGYRCIPILDGRALSAELLVEWAVQAIRPASGRILIHCANGYGRTGLFAATWLLAHGAASTPAEAMLILQSKRPQIRLRRCQWESLEEASRIISEMREKTA